MLQATIVALPKPGKKPESPQNFRPISLLNTDLKIYAKIIAKCLAKITPQLVKADQVGFVKSQQAPDGTRRLYNLFQIAETHNAPTVVLKLDTEKAFDRVHWWHLRATLKVWPSRLYIHSHISSLHNIQCLVGQILY